jgi:hypothetical protein
MEQLPCQHCEGRSGRDFGSMAKVLAGFGAALVHRSLTVFHSGGHH